MLSKFKTSTVLPLLPGSTVVRGRSSRLVTQEQLEALLSSTPWKDSKVSFGYEQWDDQNIAPRYFKNLADVRTFATIKAYLGAYYDDLLANDLVDEWEMEVEGALGSKQDLIDWVVEQNVFEFTLYLDPDESSDRAIFKVDLQGVAVAKRAVVAPPSPLGEVSARKKSGNKIVFVLKPNLITVTVDTVTRSMYLDHFFYNASAEARTKARQIAKAAGRTLGGLGMEWVKAVAESQGVTDIRLTDAWTGSDGIQSGDLKQAAKMARMIDNVNRRAARARPAGNDDPDFRDSFLRRVEQGGYYGQWGFVDDDGVSAVRTAKMADINAAFLDMAVYRNNKKISSPIR